MLLYYSKLPQHICRLSVNYKVNGKAVMHPTQGSQMEIQFGRRVLRRKLLVKSTPTSRLEQRFIAVAVDIRREELNGESFMVIWTHPLNEISIPW